MPDKHNEEASWEDMDWGEVAVERPATQAPLLGDSMIPVAPAKPAEPEPIKLEECRPLPPVRKPATKKGPATAGALVFTPASVATLTLSNEGQEDTVLTVKDQLTVGRHKSNDLVIKDLHVSNYHAKFVCRENGVFEVVDLNSSGGTFVSGERVGRIALKNGDEIQFANVAALFRYVAGPQFDSDDEFAGTLVQWKTDVARKKAKINTASKQAVLVMADGVRTVLPLLGVITIGRGEENDLMINERHVSGCHARLVGSGGGVFEVFDLDSTCGTHINGVPVLNTMLVSGDAIRFGVVECLFEIVESGGSPVRHEASEREEAEAVARPLPEPRPAGPPIPQRPLTRKPDR